MKKSKVLFCIESLYCGGAEISLVSLLNNLDKEKYEYDILIHKTGGEFEKFLPKSVSLKCIDYKVNLIQRIKFKLLRLFNIFKKYHNAQLYWKSVKDIIPYNVKKYDLAIAWGQGFATYYVSQRVDSNKKYAWINVDYKKAGYYWQQDVKIYDSFNKIIGVSDFVKESAQSFLPKNKVISIRDIIDPLEITLKANQSKSEKFNPNKINIVSVGRLAKQKGFEMAIQAINILKVKKQNIHLYIIGEGSERSSLEKLISKNNLDDDITLIGFKENPYPYIKDCDIYLQSSWFEGLGRTIIEAKLLCKPIVTTDFPTAFSILEHNKTGLITPMKPKDIASAILDLIRNEDLKATFIKNLKLKEDQEKNKTLSQVYNLFNS